MGRWKHETVYNTYIKIMEILNSFSLKREYFPHYNCIAEKVLSRVI